MLKEIQEDISCPGTGRFTVKMSILLKAIYRISAILIKIPMMFLATTEKLTLKFTGISRDPK